MKPDGRAVCLGSAISFGIIGATHPGESLERLVCVGFAVVLLAIALVCHELSKGNYIDDSLD